MKLSRAITLGEDRNYLMSELVPISGLLGPPSPRNQRVKKKIYETHLDKVAMKELYCDNAEI
jgi:hypothetical protein